MSLFLNMLTFGDDFMSSGNEFHRTGAADEKDGEATVHSKFPTWHFKE